MERIFEHITPFMEEPWEGLKPLNNMSFVHLRRVVWNGCEVFSDSIMSLVTRYLYDGEREDVAVAMMVGTVVAKLIPQMFQAHTADYVDYLSRDGIEFTGPALMLMGEAR